MRAWIAVLLLLVAAAPAVAHDGEWGLAHCYDGRHCLQDTLVLGLVTRVDTDTYTLRVTKVLQSNQPLRQGTDLHFTRAQRPAPFRQTPQVGRPFLVSFLRRGFRSPYMPTSTLRCTTTNWRTTRVDAPPPLDMSYTNRFLRTGGEPCSDRRLANPSYPLHERVTFFLRTHTPAQVYGTLAAMALPVLTLTTLAGLKWRRRHRPR